MTAKKKPVKTNTTKANNTTETELRAELKAEVTSSICWLAEYLAVARLADTTEAISLARAELDRLASLLNHAGLLDTSQWKAWQHFVQEEATTASQKVAT